MQNVQFMERLMGYEAKNVILLNKSPLPLRPKTEYAVFFHKHLFRTKERPDEHEAK